ncbi:MAG: HlyD family type I secretion periplasmic adaptor subunit [Alphaproteobacteria bacterium]
MTDIPRLARARLPLVIGLSAIVLLVGGLGVWGTATRIAGAVVARGSVTLESDRQVVQHPDGGVVGEILARNGDRVAAGDVLVRLDGTFLRTELVIVQRQLMEIYARRKRLEAERDDAEAPDYSDLPTYSLLPPEAVAEQTAGQTSLFEARRTSIAQTARQLREQQAQIERQIEGYTAQRDSLDRQLALIAAELADVQNLFDRGLIESSRLLVLQREEAQLVGEIGRLNALVAEARARISGLEIEILRLSDTRRETAIAELRDLQYAEISVEERNISLTEQLARLDVRAPVDGTVFGSRVFAVQSVVQAAEPMMFLVPGEQPLRVSARIDPVDVDQVHAGQAVSLQFTSFNRRTTPEVPGEVLFVSPDVQTDEASGTTFYEAIIIPDPDAVAELDDLRLMPGMPVETFLRTDDRTPLSYLVQPLAVYFQRAFREE